MFKNAGHKLSIPDATEAYASQFSRLAERTIRRAVISLYDKGFLIESGKFGKAMTYVARDISAASDDKPMLSFAGSLMDVETFVSLFVSENSEPFKRNMNIMSQKHSHLLRRMVAFAVLSAGNSGAEEQLKNVNKTLRATLGELEHIKQIINGILDSPIWYEQYRDKIAYQLRRIEQKNPELIQLAQDFVSSQ